MNIIPIILLSVLIILLIAWCIQERNSSHLNFHLDCFLTLNNYVKRSFYKVLHKYTENESSKTLQTKLQNIDNFLIPLSQNFTKGIIHFPRKNELIQELRYHVKSHNSSIDEVNLFLLPDTLVNKSNPTYYKALIDKVTSILGQECHVKTNQEAKLILESL